MFLFSRWLDLILKGHGHRYLKRIPYMSGGKRRYRYIYKVTHTHRGRHVLDPQDMIVGAKFMIHADKGKEVHAHITQRMGDTVTITYDDGERKGQSETMRVSRLVALIDQSVEVGTKAQEQRKKIVADIEQARKTGSEKQIARLEERRSKIDRLIDEAGLLIDHPAYKRGGSPFMAFIEALLNGRDTIPLGEYTREIDLLLKSGLITEGEETEDGVKYAVTDKGRAKYQAYIEEKIEESFSEEVTDPEELPDLIPDVGDDEEPPQQIDEEVIRTKPRKRLPDLGEVIAGARKMMDERNLTTAEMRKSFTRDKLTGWRGLVKEADTLQESGNTPSASILKQAIISAISATPFKLGKNDPSVVLQWTATGETATENAGLVYKDGVAFVMKSLEACKTEQDVLTFLYEWSELAVASGSSSMPATRDHVFNTFDEAKQSRELHDGIMQFEVGRYGDLIPKGTLNEDESTKTPYANGGSAYMYGVRRSGALSSEKYFYTEEEAVAFAKTDPEFIIDVTRNDSTKNEAGLSYSRRSNVAKDLTINQLESMITSDQGRARYKNTRYGDVPEELRRSMHLMTQILSGIPVSPSPEDIGKVAKRYGARLTDPKQIERAIDREFRKRRDAVVKKSGLMNLVIFKQGAYSPDTDKELKFPRFRLKKLNDLFEKAQSFAGKSWEDPEVSAYFERSAEKKKTGWRFKREASGSAVRVGGSKIPANITQEMMEAQMGLRGIQWGKSMTRTDQDTHVVNCFGALTDLADVIGVPVARMGLNGDLALAYGARGQGGAKAHYEPQERVINLTKQTGAGSLAHEWGHALDHALHTHYGIGKPTHAVSDSRGTSNTASLVSVQLFNSEYNPSVSSKLPPRVRDAYRAVLNAMMYSPIEKPTQEQVDALTREINDTDRKIMKAKNSARRAQRSSDQMHEGRSELSYVEEHNALATTYNNLVERRDLMRKAQDPEDQKYFDTKRANPDVLQRMRERARVARETAPSRYHADAVAIGNGRGYWCGVDEMFARAFESYIEDELQSKGQENTYLVAGTQVVQTTGKSSMLTPTGESAQIYPQGEERQRINSAMRELLAVLRDEGVIKKAFAPRFTFTNAIDRLLRATRYPSLTGSA